MDLSHIHRVRLNHLQLFFRKLLIVVSGCQEMFTGSQVALNLWAIRGEVGHYNRLSQEIPGTREGILTI
ncbi:MAG TPA: hypothetical protein VFM24_09520 [Nitrospira sp.]|jgi:hypothetical protein|nr:hypothetical protein [Nitrospira sp.]